MNNIVRNAIKYLIFALPLVALVAPMDMFFPFITGKNFVFRIAVELAFALYLALALFDASYRPKWNLLTIAFTCFTSVMLVADIFAVSPSTAFWSNFERMEGFVTLAHLFAYFIVMSTILREKKDWTGWLYATSAVSVYMTAYSYLQLAGKIVINQGGVRVDGLLGNASYLAVYMLFHIFFLLYLLCQKEIRNVYARVAAVVLIALELVILYNTATRGAILGLIGGVLISAVYIAWKERESALLRKSAFSLVGLVIIIVGGFYAARNTDFVRNSPVLSRFATISWHDSTATQAREYVWPMAINGFKENPILGWGQEGFMYVFQKYDVPEMYNQEAWFDRAHNAYLDWLVAGGALGLLSYLSLYILALYMIWKSNTFIPREKAILLGLLAAYAFQELFIFDNLVSYMLFASLLALVASQSNNDQFAQKIKNESIEEIGTPIMLSVVGLFILAAFLINGNAYAQNIELIKALGGGNKGVGPLLVSFQKALDRQSFGTFEGRTQMSLVASQVVASSQVSDTDKAAFATATISEFEDQIKKTPYDARAYLQLGDFLSQIGSSDEAIELLSKAVALSPEKQQITLSLAQAYFRKALVSKDPADNVKGLQLVKDAHEKSPQFDNLRLTYVRALLINKKIDEAVSVMNGVKNPVFFVDTGLMTALIEQGRIKDAIASLRKAISYDKAHTEAYVLLADIYLYQKDKVSAIKVFRELEVAVPSQKDQVEKYLSQIEAMK